MLGCNAASLRCFQKARAGKGASRRASASWGTLGAVPCSTAPADSIRAYQLPFHLLFIAGKEKRAPPKRALNDPPQFAGLVVGKLFGRNQEL
jgi:hypothetical protein